MGDYRPEHLFCLQQALESYRHFQSQIAACDEHIKAMLARFDSQEQCAEAPCAKYKAQGNQPAFDVPSEMHRILGVDLTAIPGMSAQGVLTFFCEVGPQITRFPSSRHFASWLGLCPDNRISGGKILSSKAATCAAGLPMPCAWPRPLYIAATLRLVTIFAVSVPNSVLPRPLPPPLTSSLASSLPCSVIAVLSTLISWAFSTKSIFAALTTPCANSPLLWALNLFPYKTLPIQFLRRLLKNRAVSCSDLDSEEIRKIANESRGPSAKVAEPGN